MTNISTGAQLTTFITGLNGGATIDPDLLTVLVSTAKAILEEERPWQVLRKTDTSKSVTTANTWQTAISLATITDFSIFYGELPIRLFDPSTNRIEYYRQVPFDRRLEYKDVGNTFVFDENANTIYLNGVIPFAGTLYINYSATSPEIDLTSSTAVWTIFPARFLPILGFYAIGVNKGAIDFDDINYRMVPANQQVLTALKAAMESWDNARQQSSIEGNDPESLYSYPRGGAIDINQ